MQVIQKFLWLKYANNHEQIVKRQLYKNSVVIPARLIISGDTHFALGICQLFSDIRLSVWIEH